jgi:hypothetical protein
MAPPFFHLRLAAIPSSPLSSPTTRPRHKNRKPNTETEKTGTETEKTGTEQTRLLFGYQSAETEISSVFGFLFRFKPKTESTWAYIESGHKLKLAHQAISPSRDSRIRQKPNRHRSEPQTPTARPPNARTLAKRRLPSCRVTGSPPGRLAATARHQWPAGRPPPTSPSSTSTSSRKPARRHAGTARHSPVPGSRPRRLGVGGLPVATSGQPSSLQPARLATRQCRAVGHRQWPPLC